MYDSGASIIELQIPFSDPMADGPSIMHANEVALAKGVRTKDCMQAMEKLSAKLDMPFLFMSYYNLLHSYGKKGLDGFLKDAQSSGAEGLIVPDVPFDLKRENFAKKALSYKLTPIPLVSPVTPKKRLKEISKVHDKGFVYCVATTGTTLSLIHISEPTRPC